MAGFNTNDMGDVDPHTGGGKQRVDSGDYNVMVSTSAFGPNKKNNGSNLHLVYTVLDGNFQGVEIDEYLSVINPSEQAQNISRSKLESILTVTGMKADGKTDTDDLQGRSMRIRVMKNPNEFINDKGETVKTFNNDVTVYMDMDSKNAKGDTVSAFIPKDETSSNRGSTSSGGSSSSQSSGGQTSGSGSSGGSDDSDIPF